LFQYVPGFNKEYFIICLQGLGVHLLIGTIMVHGFFTVRAAFKEYNHYFSNWWSFTLLHLRPWRHKWLTLYCFTIYIDLYNKKWFDSHFQDHGGLEIFTTDRQRQLASGTFSRSSRPERKQATSRATTESTVKEWKRRRQQLWQGIQVLILWDS
jgi:hypothetical protein